MSVTTPKINQTNWNLPLDLIDTRLLHMQIELILIGKENAHVGYDTQNVCKRMLNLLCSDKVSTTNLEFSYSFPGAFSEVAHMRGQSCLLMLCKL